jgi:D-amino-acid dehydrogenase
VSAGGEPSPDVIVIGGGIVGAACAHELAGRGASVTVLERLGGWGEGCSWGNAGLIVPSHSRPIAAPEALRSGLGWMLRRDSPFGLRLRPSLAPWLVRYLRASTARRAAAGERLQRGLAQEGLAVLRELEAEGVDAGLAVRGCLSVHTSAHAQEHAQAEAGSETGRALGAEVLGAAQARALEPALTDAVRAGVLFPHEAQVDPGRLVRSLGAAAEARGVRLLTGARATGLRTAPGGVTVETEDGPLRAGHVVVAAGAWSGQLAKRVGVTLPLQGGKGYAVEYAPADAPLRMPLYLHDHRCVATPMGDRTRVTGGLLLDGLDEREDPRRVAAIERAARAAIGVAAAPKLSWKGLRPCTPDGLPVIGAHPRAPRVVFATGHGMLGVTLGPLTGRMVAGAVGGEPPHPGLAQLAPDRFAGLARVVRSQRWGVAT